MTIWFSTDRSSQQPQSEFLITSEFITKYQSLNDLNGDKISRNHRRNNRTYFSFQTSKLVESFRPETSVAVSSIPDLSFYTRFNSQIKIILRFTVSKIEIKSSSTLKKTWRTKNCEKMSNKNENFELLERIRRELDLENGKIWINTVTFTEHATCSGFLAWLIAEGKEKWYVPKIRM